MIRSGKKLFLFSMLFMCGLLVTFGMNGSLVCSAANPEYSDLTAPEKTLTILKDVVGLDTATYSTNLDTHTQDLYFEVLPQENVKYILESDEGKLEVICTFVNEKLRSMITYTDGSPRMTQPATNTLEMAKDFIDKYQTISSTSHYETMRSMLDNLEANKNVTKTSENVKLEVTSNTSYTSFRWTYTINGAEASVKCVAMRFEKGFLKYFVDTWNLYTIGSTDINLSEEEAINIAMDRAKNFSWNVSMGGDKPPVTVTEFKIVGVSKTTLDIGNYISKKDARGGNPLTLYPGWNIKLYFDKLYLGNVYGLDVGIWADTGEVNDIRTMFSMGDYLPNVNPADNEDAIGQSDNEVDADRLPIAWIVLPISIVITLGATKVYFRQKKRISPELHNMPKSNSLKLGGVLLCLIFLLTTFSMATPTVKADTYGMTLYGSTAGMVDDEESAAMEVIEHMEDYFEDYAGYTCFDYYGSNTQKEYVLGNASVMEQSYDHVAMFHHGHGGMYSIRRDYFDDDWDYYNPSEDDEIWDYQVYPQTWRSKHFFVFIWTCRQGDTIGGYYGPVGVFGMPYCWHHAVTSGDCFIGFTGASMPLIQESVHYSYDEYTDWVISFIYHGTYNHYTIAQALNQASIDHYGVYYYETELYQGYDNAWHEFDGWPINGTYGSGAMRIYGNLGIHLY